MCCCVSCKSVSFLADMVWLNNANSISVCKLLTGLNYTGIQNFNTIGKGIKLNSSSKKNLEVLIHPGYTNSNEIKIFKKKYYKYYSSSKRLAEFQIASSRKFLKIIMNQ